jgi:uncharacterized membrane protein YsdA (DUF1294 family)
LLWPALYLLAVSVAAFLAFVADKRRAEQFERRIPERTLLTLAAIGGWPGAIAAQQLVRHKTRKEPFRTLLWSIAAVELVFALGWALHSLR